MKTIFVVEPNHQNTRLDLFLNENLEDITRSQIKNSIDKQLTKVNGKPAKAGKTLKAGDVVEFEKNEILTDAIPENIPLDIVYEDEDLAVINKPQGMTVHPAAGNYNGTLVNALLYHFDKVSDIGGNIRPGIVHRIDKDTSGLLVIAKTNSAHISLASQIANKTCKRTYIALCEGVVKVPDDEQWGTIDFPIARSKKDRKQMAVDPTGKRAVTHYTVLKCYQNYTLVRFDLETGRTHQIRVHCKHIGHPIVGDPVYGFKAQKFALNGQLLHAFALQFEHPRTGKIMKFEVPIPDYFEKTLSRLKICDD